MLIKTFHIKKSPWLRGLSHPGEILNCDLTEANGTALDPNNNYHFLESSITDFYLRMDAPLESINHGQIECDSLKQITETTTEQAILVMEKVERSDKKF